MSAPVPMEGEPRAHELSLNRDQYRDLQGFIEVVDLLRGREDIDEPNGDRELVYRFESLMYQAQCMEDEGQRAQGFRLAITGAALGAAHAVGPMPILDAMHRHQMLVPADAHVLGQFVGNAKDFGKKMDTAGPEFANLLRNQMSSIDSYVHNHLAGHDAPHPLALAALTTIWTASRNPALRKEIADRVSREYGPVTAG